MRRFAVAAAALVLASCAHPTKSSESEDRAFAAHSAGAVTITPQTIVVDARPAFEYSTAHVPHSVPMAWGDYTEAEPAQHGVIQHDTFGAARRLSRAGLAPGLKVVVVGDGLKGGGEEGRIAWMLAYFGINDVQFASLDSLKPRLTNEPESQPPASQPVWKPVMNESLHATRDEVLFAINQNAFVTPASYKGAAKGAAKVLYRFIDVRSERAYLGKEGVGALKHVPNLESMNVPWAQFFTPSMRVNEKTLAQIKSMGFKRGDRIIVLDDDGVASAAVTMALRDSGFTNAANYAGGFQDLIP